MLNVLIVDDEDIIRLALKRIFEKLGCKILEADSIERAVSVLSSQHVDATFCDVRFPGNQSGTELLELVIERKHTTKVVMMSCAMDDETSVRLIGSGAAMCVEKPFFKAECREMLTSLFPEEMTAT